VLEIVGEEKLTGAVTKILKGQIPASRFEKCFALFVLAQSASNDDFRSESQELYLHRNEGSDEDRALLAIGLHRQSLQEKLRELGIRRPGREPLEPMEDEA